MPTQIATSAPQLLILVLAMIGPVDALACSLVDGSLALEDVREYSDEPDLVGEEVLIAGPGNVWWIHRRGATNVVLEPIAGSASIDVEIVLTTETSYAIRVPQEPDGSSWQAKLVNAESDPQDFILAVDTSVPGPQVQLPDMVVASVRSETYTDARGCGGFVPVMERSFANATVQIDSASFDDIGLQLWNLPTGEILDPITSPAAIDLGAVPVEVVNGEELELQTFLDGTRTLYVRLVDLNSGATGQVLEIEMPPNEEPVQVGTVWLGLGCSGTGAATPVPAAAGLALWALRRRRSRRPT